MGALVDPLDSLRKYLAADRAPSTRKSYGSDFAHFKTWCDAAGEACLPAEPIAVARYLAAAADSGLKASTIVRRACAISFFHIRGGHESPCRSPGVRSVIRGIRRTIGTAPNRKAPATAQILAAVIEQLPDNLIGLRDRALLLIGFAAALRRSELVALDVGDLEIVPEGVRVFLTRSKVDQAGEGYTISVPAGTKLKPVAALSAWLEASGITNGPLFRPVDRHGNLQSERLTDRSVARIVKRAVRGAGLDDLVFSGHSLRTGFVTSALDDGADVLRIMDVTRHKGLQQLKVYDRRARGFRGHAGKDFL